MNHSDVHFCLVSKQPLPVLIPLLSDPGRPKAAERFKSDVWFWMNPMIDKVPAR